jgi:hypothetical protein
MCNSPRYKGQPDKKVEPVLASSNNLGKEDLLNRVVELGIQTITSTVIEKKDKTEILFDTVDSLIENADKPYPYIIKMLKTAYKIMTEKPEQYSLDVIEKMKTELDNLEKQSKIGENDYLKIVKYSMNLNK